MNLTKPPKHRPPRKQKHNVVKDIRDTILFVVGILGIIHEEYFSDTDRHWLILLYGGMIGLTTWLRIDEQHNSGDDE